MAEGDDAQKGPEVGTPGPGCPTGGGAADPSGQGDGRSRDKLEALAESEALDERWTDLRKYLERDTGDDMRYELYLDGGYDPDYGCAAGMADLDGALLRPIEGGGHKIAKQMRETGELQHALAGALDHGRHLPAASRYASASVTDDTEAERFFPSLSVYQWWPWP